MLNVKEGALYEDYSGACSGKEKASEIGPAELAARQG